MSTNKEDAVPESNGEITSEIMDFCSLFFRSLGSGVELLSAEDLYEEFKSMTGIEIDLWSFLNVLHQSGRFGLIVERLKRRRKPRIQPQLVLPQAPLNQRISQVQPSRFLEFVSEVGRHEIRKGERLTIEEFLELAMAELKPTTDRIVLVLASGFADAFAWYFGVDVHQQMDNLRKEGKVGKRPLTAGDYGIFML